MSKWKQHPLSAAFPPMSDEEVEGLLADLRANGLRDPVVIYEGMVLDGWHRVQMCPLAGVEIRTKEFPERLDPMAYVISKNLHRRSLSSSQRAAAVTACTAWAQNGYNQHTESGGDPGSPPPSTNAQMAEMAGVSERTIQRAKKAEKAGLGDQVRSGELSAKEAATKSDVKTGGDPGSPPPKKPSKVELLQAEIQDKQDHIKHLEDNIDDLRHELSISESATLPETEQLKKIDVLERKVSTLTAQVNDHLTKNSELQKRVNWLQKKLGQYERGAA